MPPLFVSVFAYAWAKNGGTLKHELEDGERASTAAFRTLARIRSKYDAALCLETSTLIARARCRAAGAFLASKLPVWLTLDEDVDASLEAVDALLAPLFHFLPVPVALGAMRLRTERRFNVELAPRPEASAQALLSPGAGTYPAVRGGLALAAMTRASIENMAACHAELDFVEDVAPLGRIECPGLFLETIRSGAWQGEDMMFCERARSAGVPLVAVLHPGVTHAGLSNAELLK